MRCGRWWGASDGLFFSENSGEWCVLERGTSGHDGRVCGGGCAGYMEGEGFLGDAVGGEVGGVEVGVA